MDKYEQVYDGDKVEVAQAGGINICCCDCGLVHHIDVKVKRGNVTIMFSRNNRKTAAMRRWHFNGRKGKSKDE